MTDVYETRDADLLRGALESDRVGAVYLLGDLEPPFFENGTWLVATRASRPTAAVLVYRGFSVPTVLSFGEVEGVEAILDAHKGPEVRESDGPEVRASDAQARGLPGRCYLKIPPEHEMAFAARFQIVERDEMKVMALERRSFRPAGAGHDVRRLDTTFPIDEILAVYKSYPGHFFEPGQLATGTYFGSFEGGRLVAVAGTHVYSPAGRVAAVGNVVTASDVRGRGHAAACTSAVITELYARGCDTIALHVAAANAAAQACYRRLGFHEHGPVLQLRAAQSEDSGLEP